MYVIRGIIWLICIKYDHRFQKLSTSTVIKCEILIVTEFELQKKQISLKTLVFKPLFYFVF